MIAINPLKALRMFNKNRITLVLVSIAALFISMKTPDSETRIVVNKMLSAIDNHKSSMFTMRSNERLVNMKELRNGDIFTKVQVSPHKLYMKMVTEPNKGTEILYVASDREGKALVNPGKFLPTVKLNPFNSMLTKDQHHTILSAGFSLVPRVVRDGVKRADAEGKFDEVFKYTGDVTWNGRKCYKLVIEDPTYKYTTYTAQKGENMYHVALKKLVPEYSLVELNGVKNFEEDLGGRTLKIPTAYAKKTIMYIDKENYFPIFQEMHDDKGVFERYEYFNLVVNPRFAEDEFSKDFKDYNF